MPAGSASAWCSSISRCSNRLTVAENIALGINDPAERVGLDQRIIEISREYGLPLDPDRTVHDLSVGERQRIEIVRCLLQKPASPDHGRADLGADAAGGRDAV